MYADWNTDRIRDLSEEFGKNPLKKNLWKSLSFFPHDSIVCDELIPIHTNGNEMDSN